VLNELAWRCPKISINKIAAGSKCIGRNHPGVRLVPVCMPAVLLVGIKIGIFIVYIKAAFLNGAVKTFTIKQLRSKKIGIVHKEYLFFFGNLSFKP
jgi:hypothetical protein